MNNSPLYSDDKIVKAITFAFKEHSDQRRKGTNIPYIVHPIDVASILMKNSAPENVLIAGLLHDVVEDTDSSIQQIEEIFGTEVANLVQQSSEPSELLSGGKSKRVTWRARKSHTISRIKELGYEAKLLSCADKLANIRDMVNEQKIVGEAFWGKFNASKEEQSWYYNALLEAYSSSPPDIIEKPVFLQFREAVMSLFPPTS